MSIVELEALGLFWCCEQLEEYLRIAAFNIRTDHKPLIFMLAKQAKKRIRNWLLAIAELPVKSITHIQGKDNLLADVLSRFFLLRDDMKKNINDGSEALLRAMEERNLEDLKEFSAKNQVISAVSTRKTRKTTTVLGKSLILSNSGAVPQEKFSLSSGKEIITDIKGDEDLARALQEIENEELGPINNSEDFSEEERLILEEPFYNAKFPSKQDIKRDQEEDKDCSELISLLKSSHT